MRRTDPSGVVTRYIYDGDDLAMELDGSGNRLREYTYYPGVDRPHSMRQWANGENGAIYYYRGPARQRDGALPTQRQQHHPSNEYRYTPWGEAEVRQEGTPNPLRYMSREIDGGTGLYYVRNRWYDVQLGRFLSSTGSALGATALGLLSGKYVFTGLVCAAAPGLYTSRME